MRKLPAAVLSGLFASFIAMCAMGQQKSNDDTGAFAAQSLSPEMLENVVKSSVFIRAERVFKIERFPSSGSGIFVHPDGYILTNWHVVADQVGVDLWEKEREANAKVVSLSVVVNSGSPGERELPAKIIARDRRRDLALLRVDHRPTHYIDTNRIPDVGIGQQVWAVGFPFGDLLSLKDEVGGDPNPEVSISRGFVTSLRRDSAGQLAMIQTDAALYPGNSGGAIVDASGQLVAVASATVPVGQGIGFGVSSNRIRDFLVRQSIRVEIRPSVVLSPPQPILVAVTPILLGSDLERGEVRFEGEDIEPVSYTLQPVEGKVSFTATIAVPEPIPGRQRPQKYFAVLTLYPGNSEEPIRRRYSLDVIPDSFETLKSERDPGRMMDDRTVLAHEVSIPDYTEDQQVAGGAKDRKRLSDIAGSVKLERDDSSSIVVDQRLVREVGGVSFDPERYKRIGDSRLRRQLEKYDRLAMDIASFERLKRAAFEGSEYASWAYAFELEVRITEMREKRSELARILGEAKIRWCADLEVYFVADGKRAYYPCSGQSLY